MNEVNYHVVKSKFEKFEAKQVELESDNAMLIEFIRNGWASRDANKVVDCIAKVDSGVMDELIIFEDPPSNARDYSTVF
ncbi:hypothetical protein Goarm_013026, partial [Gossypium armourianum]|nr:hypothetical protein [Gossypium armourianum]